MSAADVITYIGVPLAVLGVLPILYTTVTTFLNLRLIRRLLNQNSTSALTRASFVSGFVELTFSRTALTPLDREDPAYWEPRPRQAQHNYLPIEAVETSSPSVSRLPGAGWTKLNWRTRVAGSKTYRIQRVEEVRTPQAEVDLGELVRFLVDRGAVVERRGWEVLRRAGMWTPAGTRLLTTKRVAGNETGASSSEGAVLTVAVPEDSDGVLSLQIRWDREWGKISEVENDQLAPGWTVIRSKRPVDVDLSETKAQLKLVADKTEDSTKTEGTPLSSEVDSTNDMNHVAEFRSFLDVQLAPWGITEARCRTIDTDRKINAYSSKVVDISHLDADTKSSYPSSDPTITPGLWASSAATALNGTSALSDPSPLWPHTVSSVLAQLSGKVCIPVGVLVILDLLPAKSAPSWELSVEPDANRDWSTRASKMQEELEEDRAIDRLPIAQQAAARQAKQIRKTRNVHNDMLQKQEEKRLHQERRAKEALSSTKWASKAVAETCATWLAGGLQKEHQVLPQGSLPRDAVENVMWNSIMREEDSEKNSSEHLAAEVAAILQLWQGWADHGGLTRGDLDTIRSKKEIFAYAACVLAVVGSFAGSPAEKTGEDVRECVRNWPIVRVG
ncbi:MAG: hypothetical protein M1828_006089 [Chrysothrix sp. TS-e1954]|nr:MAG: hypothetical protein M1828_006089 [Chrysothrix sp. TS-e1954]